MHVYIYANGLKLERDPEDFSLTHSHFDIEKWKSIIWCVMEANVREEVGRKRQKA
jgi:hypothetical protein